MHDQPLTSTTKPRGTLRARLSGVTLDAKLTVLTVLAFLGVTVWWLTQEGRVQDWDNGRHTVDAYVIYGRLSAGQLTASFTEFNSYPPLGHLIGALGIFIGGISPASVVVASNVVFVPLLAAGCFGVGRLVFGSERAGLLAALFALGTPMIVSEMHEFLLDPQQAAMVAVSVWAILASRRFERLGCSALAGALVGLAMLTKETSVVFVGGLLLVVLARGGWRNWRGLLAFAIVAGAITLPWYIYHYDQLAGLTGGATAGTSAAAGANAPGGVTPSRFSRKNAAWYFWDLLNEQVLAPLMLLLMIGVAVAVWRIARRRDAEDLTLELLGGGLGSYLGMTYIALKDPRYTLPALVYIAVLGSGWITTVRPSARRWLTVALLIIVLVNFIGVSFGVGKAVRVAFTGAPTNSLLHERSITLYSPEGWLRGGPERDGDILALMRGLKRIGVHSVTFDAASSDDINFNSSGLQVLAIEAGVPPTWTYNPAGLGPRDAFVLRRFPQPGDPPPCQRLKDGSGVYIVLGNPIMPFAAYTFVCPGRTPLAYKRTAPLPVEAQIQLHPEITGPSRALLLGVMQALRREDVPLIQFDPASANALFFNYVGLVQLAGLVKLAVQSSYAPQQLGPTDAFLLRKPIAGGGPAPCGRFPDGTGLYVVRGSPLAPAPHYQCPAHTRP